MAGHMDKVFFRIKRGWLLTIPSGLSRALLRFFFSDNLSRNSSMFTVLHTLRRECLSTESISEVYTCLLI